VIDLRGGLVTIHPTKFHPNNRLNPNAQGPWTKYKHGSRMDLSRAPPKSIRAYDRSYIADMPECWYAVTDHRLGVGWGVVYSQEVFRYLWYWQSLDGGYRYPWYGRTRNVGLEPFTSYGNEGLASAIENRTALGLEPGQRIEKSLKAIACTCTRRIKRIYADGSVDRRA
jgi:hypothetical protein